MKRPLFIKKEDASFVNDFTFPYGKVRFQLLETPRLAMRPKERVDVHELPSGVIHLFVRGRKANFRPAAERLKNTVATVETLTT